MEKTTMLINATHLTQWCSARGAETQKCGLIVFWLIYFDSGSEMAWMSLKTPLLLEPF